MWIEEIYKNNNRRKLSADKNKNIINLFYIRDIECGRRNITFRTLYKLAGPLNVEIFKFFQFD